MHVGSININAELMLLIDTTYGVTNQHIVLFSCYLLHKCQWSGIVRFVLGRVHCIFLSRRATVCDCHLQYPPGMHGHIN